MGRLTSRPLYEWEQIAKRENLDIDKIREDYWDEMAREGLLKPKKTEEASHLQKLLGTMLRAIPRVATEQAIGAVIPPGPFREAARLGTIAGGVAGRMPVEDIAQLARMPERGIAEGGRIAQEKFGGVLEEAGLPELEPTTNEEFFRDPLSTSGRFVERTLAESIPYFAMPYGRFTGAITKAPLKAVGLEAALFGGGATASGLAEGEGAIDALARGAATGAGVAALGAGVRGIGKMAGELKPQGILGEIGAIGDIYKGYTKEQIKEMVQALKKQDWNKEQIAGFLRNLPEREVPRVKPEVPSEAPTAPREAIPEPTRELPTPPTEAGTRVGPEGTRGVPIEPGWRSPAPPWEPPAAAPGAPPPSGPGKPPPTTPTEPPPPKPPSGGDRLDDMFQSTSRPAEETAAVDAAIGEAGHQPPQRPYQTPVDRVREAVAKALEAVSFRGATILEHIEHLKKTGTLPKEARPEFRAAHEAGLGEAPSGWYQVEISPEKINLQRQALFEAADAFNALISEAHRSGDVVTLRAAKELRKELMSASEQFNLYRKVAGESVRLFQMTPEQAFRFAALNDGLKALAARPPRLPLYTSIKKNVLKLVNERKDLSPQAKKDLGEQLLRDSVDAWRLNLFSVTSFTLDLIGNLVAATSEGAGLIGQDLYNVMRGKPNLLGLRSMFYGLRGLGKKTPLEIEQALGTMTASGEMVSGMGGGKGNIVQRGMGLGRPGTFTSRGTNVSAAIDSIVGAPLYAKGAVDTGFKRMGAWAALYRKANQAWEASEKRGNPVEWMRDFVDAMKPEDIAAVVEQANKLGFNRALSPIEESIAGSPVFKLAFGAFPRWPFQFTRAIGEWVGLNPKAWQQIAKGPNRGEAIANYLGKSLTGLGGLYFINDTLYDHVDFKSMEYVHENGDRSRLSGREPLPTVLALSAALKGDWINAKSALKYTSLPGASVISGEGGLVWTLVQRIQQAAQRRDFDPKAVEKEAIKILNRLIPGQALLAMTKSIFDPVSREGLGAEIPGVSLALPARIDPTTGEPVRAMQKLPGVPVQIPQLSGVPIPGAKRIVDPVSQMLGSYGMLDYRPIRTPVAGIPAAKLPSEAKQKYYEILGEERSKTFKTTAPALLAKRKSIPYNTRIDLLNRYDNYERLIKGGYSTQQAAQEAFGKNWKSDLTLAVELTRDKKIIQKKDALAAKRAIRKLEQELRRARRERRL